MKFNTGDTAWVLMSAALVMFMTPGLALFYGGMVRAKNVLGMLMQNFFALGIVSILWAVVCYSLAFGGTGPLIGNFDFAFMKDVGHRRSRPAMSLSVPPLLFSGYQMMFAVITPALITGAIADRMRFKAWVWFIGIWAVARVLTGGALGVLAGGLAVQGRARSTSPAAPSCTSTPGSRRSPRCWCWVGAAAGRSTRCRRTRCR